MSVDYGPSGAALGFPYTPPQGGGGGAVALAGDVTGNTAASVVSELQGEVLTITGPLAPGQVLASDAGGTAIVNADIATVLAYDSTANRDALGIGTGLVAAPDTGWTAAGAGSAAIASGVVTLTMTSAQDGARLHRDIPASPLSPAMEVTARVTRTASPGGDFHWGGIALSSAAWDRGYTLLCQSDGNGSAGYNTAGSWATGSATAFPGAATLDNGTLWARIVITPSYVAWYLGEGASRPTSWTLLTTRAMDTALLSAASIVTLAAVCGRVTGSGTATFEVADIQWRSLLGAPT